MLIHGGFWKAEYDLTLMDALCEDLAGRGWAAWNIEYRRLGNGGGVPDDARRRLRRDRPPGRRSTSTCSRVVTIGHSAGGHLAAWAATREDAARGRHRRRLAGRRARPASGRASCGSPTASSTASSRAPTRSVASPIERLPLGVPDAAHPRRRATTSCPSRSASASPRLRRDAARRARRGPLRPPRARQPAVEGGARMALTRDDAQQLDARRPARGLPRPLRHHRRAQALPRRQLARPPAEGHARAAAPRDRPVGRRARQRLAGVDRGAHAHRRRARRGARREPRRGAGHRLHHGQPLQARQRAARRRPVAAHARHRRRQLPHRPLRARGDRPRPRPAS